MDMIHLQQNMAAMVAADSPTDEWERIVVDVEIQQEDGGYRIDTQSFFVGRNTDNSLATPDFDLSESTRLAAIAIYKERLENGGDKIGSFGLEIDRDGQYRFEICYDKPERLNGIYDSARQKRLENYLVTYKK